MSVPDGATVRVHYKGTLSDGTEFDSSQGRAPIEFTVGAGQVIPGFDHAVRNLEPGGRTTVTIPPEEAYGERNPAWAVRVPAEEVRRVTEGGPTTDPEVGDQVTVMTPDGESMALISAIENDEVVLDFNHPLAGETLTFEIELVGVLPE